MGIKMATSSPPVKAVSNPDVLNGKVQLLANANDHTAFGSAVQFGEGQAGDAVQCFIEKLGLRYGVPAGCGIKDKQCFVGSGKLQIGPKF